MIKKIALIYMAVSSPLMLITFFVQHESAAIIFALLSAAVPIALIIIGACRQGKLGPLKIPLIIFLIILAFHYYGNGCD